MAKGTPTNGTNFTELQANGVMGIPHVFVAKFFDVPEGMQWVLELNRLHHQLNDDQRFGYVLELNKEHWVLP